MTLEHPFRNFYDSDFDSRNESNIFEDTINELNLAFIESPGSSNSFVYNDVSLSNFSNSGYLKKDGKTRISTTTSKRKLMPRFRDLESEIENFQSSFASTSMDEFQKSSKVYDWIKFEEHSNENDVVENIEQTTDSTKTKEEKLDCVFTSTCLDEFQKPSEEYDLSIFDKYCNRDFKLETTEEITVLLKNTVEKPKWEFTFNCESKNLPKEYKFDTQPEKDDVSEKVEYKIKVPISRFDYTPHELSTIVEVDSLLMDESVESTMNLDKYVSQYKQGPKNANLLKENDSPETYNKPRASPNFPVNVIQVIQNKHYEKFLQEPGILEESDLTLISTDFDSTYKNYEKSTEQSYPLSYYKIKRFNVEESPSMISFLQHELSCMEDCADE